jgi:hypothetical protein
MNEDRERLIKDIARVAELLSAFPSQFQLHIQDMVGDLVTDPEFYGATLELHNQRRDTVGAISGEVRKEEPGKSATGIQSLPFYRNVMEMLAPLAEKPESREKPDKIIDILCAEIVHRRAWDEQMLYNSHTLDFLKESIG